MPDPVWDNIAPTDAARTVVLDFDRSPYQQGRDEERAAIVAWLRRVDGGRSVEEGAGLPDHLADAIEVGEHLKPGNKR